MDAAATAKLPALVAGAAFVLAFIFGAVANRVNFCTMGAVTDIVNFGDWRRMRSWQPAMTPLVCRHDRQAHSGRASTSEKAGPRDS